MTQDSDDILTNTAQANTAEEIIPQAEETTSTGQVSSDNSELEQLKIEIAQLREQIARSQADYTNLVRRSREENAQIGEWSENKMIMKFLPTLDNLERALEHTPEEFK